MHIYVHIQITAARSSQLTIYSDIGIALHACIVMYKCRESELDRYEAHITRYATMAIDKVERYACNTSDSQSGTHA